jgi:hypothetical protein
MPGCPQPSVRPMAGRTGGLTGTIHDDRGTNNLYRSGQNSGMITVATSQSRIFSGRPTLTKSMNL